MRGHPAIGVDDDLASGDAGVGLRSADDEFARRIDVILGVFVQQLGRDDREDDFLDDFVDRRFGDLLAGPVQDLFGVLGADNDRVHAIRPAIAVLDRHLRFSIRPEVFQNSLLADFRQAAGEVMREHDRQRHELWRLSAGKADHEPLVAGPADVDALGDVRGLPSDGV